MGFLGSIWVAWWFSGLAPLPRGKLFWCGGCVFLPCSFGFLCVPWFPPTVQGPAVVGRFSRLWIPKGVCSFFVRSVMDWSSNRGVSLPVTHCFLDKAHSFLMTPEENILCIERDGCGVNCEISSHFPLLLSFFCITFPSRPLFSMFQSCHSVIHQVSTGSPPGTYHSLVAPFFVFFFFLKAKVISKNESEGNLEANSFDIRTGTDSAEFSRAVLCSEAKSWLGIRQYQSRLVFFAGKHNSLSNKGRPVNLSLS